MQTIILLTLVIIAGFLFKKEKSRYARMVIGSVFGIIFLSIWPFAHFAIEIHELSKNYQLASYIVISLAAILIALLLLQIKQELTIAFIAIVLFSITIFLSITFESEIKNKISISTGYFDSDNTIKSPVTLIKNTHNRTEIFVHNYILTLVNQWQKKTDKGPLFEYFQLFIENQKSAELRPKCFNTEKTSLPEIVNNLKYITNVSNMVQDKHCSKISESSYACRISSLDHNNKIKRTRWFLLDTAHTYGIELDFVILNHQPKVAMEIEQIIDSTRFTYKSNKDINCLGLTEWM